MVTINGFDVSELSDSYIVDWLNKTNAGNKLRQKTAVIWLAIFRILDEVGPPMTVRQMYYALVSKGVYPKTEKGYDSVCYHLLQMRRRGIIPYNFLADNTRWMRKPATYDSVQEFLEIGQQAYRRSLWQNQNAYVEIWCEKDALAGVLYEITRIWDVPLMVTRGFPSETFVYNAAETLKSQTKPVFLYYFGDHDPSGKEIPDNTRQKLLDFGADFEFKQMAITPEQIQDYRLPTRPTKKTDSRAKNWIGGSVELDALPVTVLRQLVRDSIEQHIDLVALQENERIERLERDTLVEFSKNFRLAQNSIRKEVKK